MKITVTNAVQRGFEELLAVCGAICGSKRNSAVCGAVQKKRTSQGFTLDCAGTVHNDTRKMRSADTKRAVNRCRNYENICFAAARNVFDVRNEEVPVAQ